MKTTTHRAAGFLLAMSLLLLPRLASAQNLLLNPSFETPAHASWTEVLLPGPGASFPDSSATPPRTDGANGIAATETSIGNYYLYQDVVLPSTGIYLISGDMGCGVVGSTGDARDFCRFDITNTNASSIAARPSTDTLAVADPDVIQAIFSRGGDTPGVAQSTRLATFSGTGGQTIRVRFYIHASVFVTPVPIDNTILLLEGAVPALPVGMMVLLAALLAVLGATRLGRGRQSVA
jgi:hypothetical protein